MSLAHVKKHWLKYYLVVGAAYAAYEYATGKGADLSSAAVNVAAWPYKMLTSGF